MALVEAAARDADHLRILRELKLESCMIVALRSEAGRTLGAMTFIYADSGRHYSEDDLSFAEDFARRAALAIENARAASELEAARAREQAMRERAEQASITKDHFLATVSHELRTPLNVILGWAVVLRERELAPEVQRALSVIERNARAQARLIEDVLDSSRISSGKLSLTLTAVNVGEAVRAAALALRPAAEAKGITLTVDSASDEALLTIQRGLRSAAANLVEPLDQRAEIHAQGGFGRGFCEPRRFRGTNPSGRQRRGHRRSGYCRTCSSHFAKPIARPRAVMAAWAWACRWCAKSLRRTVER